LSVWAGSNKRLTSNKGKRKTIRNGILILYKFSVNFNGLTFMFKTLKK
jgi:hypothetical protein